MRDGTLRTRQPPERVNGHHTPRREARWNVAIYRRRLLSDIGEVAEAPGRARMVFLTAVLTPMAVVAALPVTAALAVAASVVANVTTTWIGLAVLVVAAVLLGYAAARMAAHHEGVPATRGWRRWLPLASTVAVIGIWVVEIASGSHAPDPVIVACLVSATWIASMLPLAAGRWGRGRWSLWIAAPAVSLVAIVFVATQGFFSLRFARAVDEFDRFHAEVTTESAAQGEHRVGGFTVHTVHQGPRIGGYENCDVGLWITGWHAEDTRYIVHCSGTPRAVRGEGLGLDHLSGNWWHLPDKTPPPDLR